MSDTPAALPSRPDGLCTISVVVPALNEAHILHRCLKALSECADPPEEIVLVDNGSTDDTVKIAGTFPRVRVISEARGGITYARTTGFDAASGEIIARIDADTIVRADWAQVIRSAFAAGANPACAPDAIAGGAAIAEISPAGRFWGSWWYRLFRLWHSRSIGVRPMIYGFNGAMRKQAWLRAKPLTALGDCTVSEDVDLTIALLRSGQRLVFLPGLIVKARLFRSIDSKKLRRYYRTDGLTLARHQYGNPRRWLSDV